MEFEQKYVMSYLHRKGMKFPEIGAVLASVYHEEAFDANRLHVGYTSLSYIVPTFMAGLFPADPP
jgi:hypothetical protein